MHKTLIQTLCAVFCAILAPLVEGGGVMRPLGFHIGMRKAAGEAPPAYWGLCFTASEADTTISFIKRGSPSEVTLKTSFDGVSWDSYATGTGIILTSAGDKVFFKTANDGVTSFSSNIANSYSFSSDKRVFASGSVMSLINGSTPTFDLSNMSGMCFCSLFLNCPILTPPDLPATELARGSYYQMFRNTKIESIDLPAPTPVDMSYGYMFYATSTLKQIRTNQTTFRSSDGWVQGVSAEGVFMCPSVLGTNDTIERGINRCPAGWTVINTD